MRGPAPSSSLPCAATGSSFRSACSASWRMRSMSSLQNEVSEIRDAQSKTFAMLKRINSREAMRDVRAARESAPSTELQTITDKAELRRRLGMVPGKPAPHNE